MYGSIYEAILANISKSEDELMEILNDIEEELFTPIIDKYKDLRPGDLKPIIHYIAYAYSKQSKVVVMGTDSAKMKGSIAERVSLPQHLFNDLVKLKNETLREVVLNYLVKQNDRSYRHLVRKRELYESLCDSQLSLRDEEGEVSIKQIVDQSKYLDALLTELEALEENYIRDYQFVEINFQEIEKVDPGRIKTLNIESHKFVKGNAHG